MWKSALIAVGVGVVSSFVPASLAVHVSADDISAAFAALPPNRFYVDQIRMLDAGGYNVGVGVAQRPATKTPTAIQHHQHTESYFITEGRGTFVSGGTLVDGAPVDSAGMIVRTLVGPSTRGVRIEGGTAREVKAGDVVIVPAGVVHGFSEIQEDLKYLVFRVDPDQLVQLK